MKQSQESHSMKQSFKQYCIYTHIDVCVNTVYINIKITNIVASYVAPCRTLTSVLIHFQIHFSLLQ